MIRESIQEMEDSNSTIPSILFPGMIPTAQHFFSDLSTGLSNDFIRRWAKNSCEVRRDIV